MNVQFRGGVVRWCVALLLGFGAVLFDAASARPVEDGKSLFQKRCSGCHTADRDGEGPRLGGVYNRPAAAVKSFDYSTALRGSGIVWNEQTLDRWLLDPGKLVPGTEMEFRVETAGERQAIVEYLKGLNEK
jgi:cytochrome c